MLASTSFVTTLLAPMITCVAYDIANDFGSGTDNNIVSNHPSLLPSQVGAHGDAMEDCAVAPDDCGGGDKMPP